MDLDWRPMLSSPAVYPDATLVTGRSGAGGPSQTGSRRRSVGEDPSLCSSAPDGCVPGSAGVALPHPEKGGRSVSGYDDGVVLTETELETLTLLAASTDDPLLA